ncbi:MAG: ABC transporter ATP-binding protein/permease [Alphaproteobacteria bacterium]|nr:MAG: ABC transporter ATP-binding protein/permease [Alphaproteobacteria bacterium]
MKKDQDNWRIFLRLLPYLWPTGRVDLKVRIFGAITCLIFAKVINVIVPILFGNAVDVLTKIEDASPEVQALAVPVALIVAFGVARFAANAFQQLRDALFSDVGFHAQRDISVETFRHLHKLSLRYHLERRTGGLARVIDRGTKAIEFLLRIAMFNLVPTIIEIVLACAVLWVVLGIQFALVVLGTIGLYVWFTFSITEWRLAFRRKMNASDTEANTKAVDSLLNYETVKYFNNEDVESMRFEKAARGYEKAAVRSYVSLSLLNGGQALIISLGFVALLLMAAYGIKAGTMSVGKFTMVQMYLLQLAVPLNMLGFVYREIKQSLVDMGRMFETLDINAEVKDAPTAIPLEISRATIAFDNVEFAYDPVRRILNGVSFQVEGGKTLAIVGPTGAGKSTISRALFRFYEISGGRITIDGQDIRNVTQASLRRAIGVVPQDTVLFNDSIYYNISYGRPDATRDEVIEAAKSAKIHEFIERLPDGYDTLVGERGLKLSGGEKQRVAIARTILKNPPILLLDEATSALDTHTEKEIQSSLDAIAKNRTTLIIAHRLSTVIHADEIIVLDAGRIVERGAHEDLLARNGVYAAMWNRQLEAAQAGAPLEEASALY